MAQKPLEPGSQAVHVGLRLTPSQAKRLDEVAAQRGQDRSTLVRHALAEHLAAASHEEAAIPA